MEKEEKSEKSGGNIASKVKALKKQYNELLIKSFLKHAEKCIDEALDQNEGPLGANIHAIIAAATDLMRQRVLGDFGVEDSGECCAGGVDLAMGGNPLEGEETGAMIDTEFYPAEEESDEKEDNEEHEKFETKDEEGKEEKETEKDEDEVEENSVFKSAIEGGLAW